MASKAKIRQYVGEDLGLVPIGQDLESQDQNRIDVVFDQVYERLKEEGLAIWASNADVPTKLVPYVQLMIEEKLLSTYSVPELRYNRIKRDAGENGDIALANIAELAIPEDESTDQAVDY